MSYSTLADLNASVAAVIGGMRDAGARPRLVARIVPFFTDRYYYMFNSMGFVWGNETGVPAYRKVACLGSVPWAVGPVQAAAGTAHLPCRGNTPPPELSQS